MDRFEEVALRLPDVSDPVENTQGFCEKYAEDQLLYGQVVGADTELGWFELMKADFRCQNGNISPAKRLVALSGRLPSRSCASGQRRDSLQKDASGATPSPGC